MHESCIKVDYVQIPSLLSTNINYEIVFWRQRHKEYVKQKS